MNSTMDILLKIAVVCILVLIMVLGVAGFIKIVDPGAFDPCNHRDLIAQRAGLEPGVYKVYALSSNRNNACGKVLVEKIAPVP